MQGLISLTNNKRKIEARMIPDDLRLYVNKFTESTGLNHVWAPEESLPAEGEV